MPDRLLIDTDILVDVARGIVQADCFLTEVGKHRDLAISSVTEMELIIGCRNKGELSQLDVFLRRYERLPVTEPVSRLATELLRRFRLSHGLLIPDALIAATAATAGIAFVSKNRKHYEFIPDLSLVTYP